MKIRELYVEQLSNSFLSFLIVRQIIAANDVSSLGNLSSLLFLIYATVTLLRIELQKSVSMNMLGISSVLRNQLSSKYVWLTLGTNQILILFCFDKKFILFFSIVSWTLCLMDFSRYYVLFTNNPRISTNGNILCCLVFLALDILNTDASKSALRILIFWATICVFYVLFVFGYLSILRSQPNTTNFVDEMYASRMKTIIFDCLVMQVAPVLGSLVLLSYSPQIAAEIRICIQVFLSIPNLLVAATAPLFATLTSRGVFSQATRFKILISQLFLFFVPLLLVLVPENLITFISGSENHSFLKFAVGTLANGASFFAISTFNYSILNFVKRSHFYLKKISLIVISVFAPLIFLTNSLFRYYSFASLVVLVLVILLVRRFSRGSLDNSPREGFPEK